MSDDESMMMNIITIIKDEEKNERRQPTVSKTGESVNYGYHPIIDFFRCDINMVVMKTTMVMVLIIVMIRIMSRMIMS